MDLSTHPLFNLLQLISRLAADSAGKMRTKAHVRKDVIRDVAFVQERAEMVLKAARREVMMCNLPSSCSYCIVSKSSFNNYVYN